MKKIVSLLLLFIVCISLFSFTVNADENIGLLKADRVTAKAGEQVTIPVSLVDHKGVCIIAVTVKYDATVLKIEKVVSSASEHFGYTYNAKNEGEVLVLMDAKTLSNIENDIKLFELKFTVKKDADPGRTLVRVFCEDGMATYLKKSGNKMEPIAFSPDTSTGSVTVLCSQHDFSTEKTDGGYQCSKCGAVKSEDGKVSVESTQGLPEIDISAGNPSESDSQTGLTDGLKTPDSNGEKQTRIKFVYFIPLIAAIVIIGGVLVIRISKLKK